MTSTLKRLRPLLIGLVVLLFTAGIAFAGRPSTPASGLGVAAEASGKTVPVRAEEETDVEEASEEEAEVEVEAELEVEEQVAAEEAGENCATDPTTLNEDELAEIRHGSIVCWAAHQETPDGYANHGEWVSEWAKENRGHADEADGAGAETTGAAADATAGRGNGKANGKSNKP